MKIEKINLDGKKDSIEVLDKLKHVSDRNDYVLSWWDYGYLTRYYADVKTLSDGGKHSGSTLFPSSFTFLNPQEEASKMLRLDAEYTEKRIEKGDEMTQLHNTNIGSMILEYGYNSATEFLSNINRIDELPLKTRDIFVYLPSVMIDILTTVDKFSNFNLDTGVEKRPPVFFVAKSYTENSKKIQFAENIYIDKKNDTIQLGKHTLPMKRFVITSYDSNKNLSKRVIPINSSAQISVIFMKDYNKFVILDERMYHSLYIQLFVLENNDKNLFEPVILTPSAKVYKLKI